MTKLMRMRICGIMSTNKTDTEVLFRNTSDADLFKRLSICEKKMGGILPLSYRAEAELIQQEIKRRKIK